MAYFAGLFGDYVFALVRALVAQLFSFNAETPRGTAIDAELKMNDLQNHKGTVATVFAS
jgi:hypothetical protein